MYCDLNNSDKPTIFIIALSTLMINELNDKLFIYDSMLDLNWEKKEKDYIVNARMARILQQCHATKYVQMCITDCITL